MRTLALVALCAVSVAGCSQGEEPVAPASVVRPSAAPKRLVHVDGDAPAFGDGTRARPFQTIQRALALLGPGVAVVVHAGEYHEDLLLRRNGSVRAPAQLRAAAGERVEIVGRLKIVADNAVVSGIVFTGEEGADQDVVLYVAGAENVSVTRCEVRRARLSGVFVGDWSANVRIVGNWIHDNGTDPGLDHGVYVERTWRGVISDNVIDGNVGYGIQLYPDADEFVVTHNTIVRNGRSGIVLGGELATSDGNVVANNVVAFNAELGIRTFWGGSIGVANRVVTNLVYGHPQGNVSLVGVEATDTVTEDPRFVALDLRDYRLAAESPALDRASADYPSATDYAGVRRPQGEASDIGALERPGA